MSTSEELLKKIESDLEVADKGAQSAVETEIYRRALNELRRVHNIQGDLVATQYEAIFAECYHQLLELQKTRFFTTSEIPLLNDLDEYEDYLIGE